MVVYAHEDVQILSSVYNEDLRKIQAECPTPHLVIFSFPLAVSTASQKEETLSINSAFKKIGWSIWNYSIFVSTRSPSNEN